MENTVKNEKKPFMTWERKVGIPLAVIAGVALALAFVWEYCR